VLEWSDMSIRGLFMFLIHTRRFNEWLLINTNSAIFQLYLGENKLIFNEMMRSALFWTKFPKCLGWCNVIVGSSPVRVKPKTIKLVFVASLLSMQH
jgi:hypothetical protein